jgi:hypothetical protein
MDHFRIAIPKHAQLGFITTPWDVLFCCYNSFSYVLFKFGRSSKLEAFFLAIALDHVSF